MKHKPLTLADLQDKDLTGFVRLCAAAARGDIKYLDPREARSYVPQTPLLHEANNRKGAS